MKHDGGRTMVTDMRPTLGRARVLARIDAAPPHFADERVFRVWTWMREQLVNLLAVYDATGDAVPSLEASIAEQAWRLDLCLDARTEAAKRRHALIVPDDKPTGEVHEWCEEMGQVGASPVEMPAAPDEQDPKWRTSVRPCRTSSGQTVAVLYFAGLIVGTVVCVAYLGVTGFGALVHVLAR